MISHHEIPLAIGLLKGFPVSLHTTTHAYCRLMTCLLTTGVVLLAKKKQPFLHFTNCF